MTAISLSSIVPYNVIYLRVSTGGQDVEMQREAALQFILKHHLTNVIELKDHGVSAIKLQMHQRPQLKELLKLVQEGMVKTLIVYSRDRLARDAYEYDEIARLLIKQGVEVIFTATNSIPFTNRIDIETMLGIFGQYEGQMIQNRTTDALKQFPSKLTGYLRKAVEGKVTYEIDPKKHFTILSLFQECFSIQNEDQFIGVLMKYGKELKQNFSLALRILQNPFYAGHCTTATGFDLLPHVQPMISLNEYQIIQEKIGEYCKKVKKSLSFKPLYTPSCALCGNSMKWKHQLPVKDSLFHCSSGHKKISIDYEQFEKQMKEVTYSFTQSLSVDQIKKCTGPFIKKLIEDHKKLEKATELEITRVSRTISVRLSPTDNNPLVDHYFEHVFKLKEQLQQYKATRLQLETQLEELQMFSQLINKALENALSHDQYFKLSQSLFDRIEVDEDHIQFHLFFAEFLGRNGENDESSF